MSITTDARAALATWAGRSIAVPVAASVVMMDLPTVMLAIGGAESGWNDTEPGDPGLDIRYGTCHGYTTWGWLQIHNVHASALTAAAGSSDPCAWAQWLYDPVHCAAFADTLIPAGQSLTALQLGRTWTTWWSTDGGATFAGYGQGAYRLYLPRARSAIAAIAAPSLPQPAISAALPARAAAPALLPARSSTPAGGLPGWVLPLALGALALVLIGVGVRETGL